MDPGPQKTNSPTSCLEFEEVKDRMGSNVGEMAAGEPEGNLVTQQRDCKR